MGKKEDTLKKRVADALYALECQLVNSPAVSEDEFRGFLLCKKTILFTLTGKK